VPLEPLYTLEVAAELIPLSYQNLLNLLFKYSDRFPARYHHLIDGPNGSGAKRMLLESECQAIRDIVISSDRHSKKLISTHGLMGFVKATKVG